MPRQLMPMSAAEKNLVSMIAADPTNPTYHLGKHFFITQGWIDIDAVTQAFQTLLDHLPGLRMGYEKGQKYLYSDDYPKFKATQFTCQTDAAVKPAVTAFLQKPYTDNDFPLFRIHLVHGPKKSVLVTTISHLIADGYSAAVTYTLFAKLYNFLF